MLLLLFPTRNSTLDAYGYAASIKNGVDLFKPHHLIYNAFQFLILKFLQLLNFKIDALSLTKVINTFFYLFNLLLISSILKRLKVTKNQLLIMLIIIAFSYSPLRFSTENENYIIPITFSLLASLYYLKYLQLNKNYYILISGFFASLACLFHQIHFIWWLGILIALIFYIKRLKAILLYVLPALIVPIAYILVIYFYNNEPITFYSISHFVLHDYYEGTAKSEIGIYNFIFLFISVIRTFFQVHPVIISLIQKNYLYIIPLLLIPFLIFYFLKLLFSKKLIQKRTSNENPIFVKTHLNILILYLLFAFYAVGNVEFMVMIPFLIFISVFYTYQVNISFLKILAFTLLIWNIFYGLIPNNIYKFYNDEELVNFIMQHPNDQFIVREQTVINHYLYASGKNDYNRIHFYIKKDNLQKIKRVNIGKNYFYTDIIDKPKVFNRASVLLDTPIDFSKNKKELIKTYKGLYGTSYIYKIYY